VVLLVALRFATLAVPLTVRVFETVKFVSVPIFVIYGWLAVLSVPDTLPVTDTFPDTTKLPGRVKLPKTSNTELNAPARMVTFGDPTIVLALTLPVTVKFAKVPIDVIFGCAFVNIVPDRLVAMTLDANTLPETFKLDNIPSDVIYGWLLLVNVPDIFPDTVKLLTDNDPAVMVLA
jgi:hypothetical protein